MPEAPAKKQKTDPEQKEKTEAAVEQNSPEEIIAKLLDDEKYGRTYCDELNIPSKPGDSDALFKWLCCSILFSSGLSETLTLKASKALLEAKILESPKACQDASQEKIVEVLDHKFQRKEQTGKYLHSAASVLLEKYDGNIYKLREAAKKDPKQERELLQEIKGLAKVGIDIFFREAQIVWEEVGPFIDGRASDSAASMGLPTDAEELQKLVKGDRRQLAVLAAALTRMALAKANGQEDLEKILTE